MDFKVSVGEMFAYAYATHRTAGTDENARSEAVAERMLEYLLSVEEDTKVVSRVIGLLLDWIDTTALFAWVRQASQQKQKGFADFEFTWGAATVPLELKIGARPTDAQLGTYASKNLVVLAPSYRCRDLKNQFGDARVVSWRDFTEVAAGLAETDDLKACWLALGDCAETIEIPRLPGPTEIDVLRDESAAKQHLATWTAMTEVSRALPGTKGIKLSVARREHAPWVGRSWAKDQFSVVYAPYEHYRLSPIWLWQKGEGKNAGGWTQIRGASPEGWREEATVEEVASTVGQCDSKALEEAARRLEQVVPLSQKYLAAGRLMWDALQLTIRMRDLGEIEKLDSYSNTSGICVVLTAKQDKSKQDKEVTLALDFKRWDECPKRGPVYLEEDKEGQRSLEGLTARDWLGSLRRELRRRLGSDEP